MTHQEFTSFCVDICKLCAGDVDVRQRQDTKEWVHDLSNRGGLTHTICMATDFRNKWKDQLSG